MPTPSPVITQSEMLVGTYANDMIAFSFGLVFLFIIAMMVVKNKQTTATAFLVIMFAGVPALLVNVGWWASVVFLGVVLFIIVSALRGL